jgi:hypothetical protein
MVIIAASLNKIVYLLRDTANERWHGEYGYIDQGKAFAVATLESSSTGREIVPIPVDVDVTSLSEDRIEDFHVLLGLDNDNKILFAKATYSDPLDNIRFIDSLVSSPELGSIKVFKIQINEYVKQQ